MGLINKSEQDYYGKQNTFGDYQFTSLEHIINQFIISYVGEDKLIPKVKRFDVAFHAQRAMQELSFDTFKSCKAQEITVPASLQMILPQDYVNYTKISWVDSAGIKHLMYPTSKTSNPFPVKQDSNNDYVFDMKKNMMSSTNLIANGDFNDDTGWTVDTTAWTIGDISVLLPVATTYNNTAQGTNGVAGYMEIAAPEIIEGRRYTISYDIIVASTGTAPQLVLANHTTVASTLNSTNANDNVNFIGESIKGHYDVTWVQGPTNTGKIKIWNNAVFNGIIDNIQVTRVGDSENSTAWSNYKSGTPSENQDDYQDDTYWPMEGSRYGLDPQHAQANGSFYIDCMSGKVHFSSNISGKTVILDYISDSLGTDGEMQVHKFAEEAMYKWILYGILSTRANVQEYVVRRFKKERFAAIRTAKLRLSNLKLEELTQILRGKSKQIKH
tara:strand:- start:5358 stop:6680 length:1323 start_codon:yes stop_codon:yes gene_type:complete